jgi:SAM-dependent methyltransferase
MNQFLHGMTRAVVETFSLPEPIVEVGAYQVEGQEALGNLRTLFPSREYLGIDMRPGPGVDLIANVEALPQHDSSVGTIIALSVFEHVRHFWRGFDEVRRVLRPNGVLLVSCPFYFHVHGYPSDYWRMTPAGLEVLLEDYPQRIIGRQGPARKPLNVWGLAFGPAYPPLTEAMFMRYRRLLHNYARQPLGWLRTVRYRLGAALCGKRPFAPYLQQESWDTACQTPLQ